MSARLIHMKCQNCGANLDLDLDHLMAFCPYCGEKLLIDVDKLHEVLIAKEETKQVLAKEQTKQKELEVDNKIKYDNFQYELEKRKDEEDWEGAKKWGLRFILIIVFMGIFFYILNIVYKRLGWI